MKYVALLGGMFLALSYPILARADCVTACLADHGCESELETGRTDTSSCGAYQSDCEAHCHSGSDSFGAVAYGKVSGAWGMSGSFSDKKSADGDAMAYCREHGSDCKIVMDLHEGCAAVAEGDNDVVAWGREATAAEAQVEAMKACTKKAGNTCDIQLWHCYYP